MDITNPNPFPNPNSRLPITMEGHAHFRTFALYQTPQLLEGTGIMRKWCGSARSLNQFLNQIHDNDYHGGTRVPNMRP
jgi:hypothetical protein